MQIRKDEKNSVFSGEHFLGHFQYLANRKVRELQFLRLPQDLSGSSLVPLVWVRTAPLSLFGESSMIPCNILNSSLDFRVLGPNHGRAWPLIMNIMPLTMEISDKYNRFSERGPSTEDKDSNMVLQA